MSLSAPSKGPPARTPVDERLVMPGSRYEVIDGNVEYVPPADELQGSRRSKLAALLEAYVARGYDTAVDMLTRTSMNDDLAPNASVYPAARDRRTGGRKLEVLAFEVVSTERLAYAARKARRLVERGVRGVFAIDVERRQALAWSRETDAWEVLSPDDAIEDKALVLPLSVRALVEDAEVDDAIARALIARKNRVIEAALAAAEARGEARGIRIGMATALIEMLQARGLEVSKKDRQRLLEEPDAATLKAWIARALTCRSVDELIGR